MFEVQNIKKFDKLEEITGYEFFSIKLKFYHIISLSTNTI